MKPDTEHAMPKIRFPAEEQAFLDPIGDNPRDAAHLLVYAD
jgi:hypothetical protein